MFKLPQWNSGHSEDLSPRANKLFVMPYPQWLRSLNLALKIWRFTIAYVIRMTLKTRKDEGVW